MKRIILVLTILFIGLAANASHNYLHTVLLEGTDDGYNIILKSDSMPEVKKTIKNSDNLILDVKGVTVSESVNAIYKSTADVSGLIVENVSPDELKIYIQAKDISKATVMSQTPDNGPVILSERFPLEKIIWSFAVLAILIAVIKSAKTITDYENSLMIKKDIKDREIELYRNFQRELSLMPKINGNISSSSILRSRRNYKELLRR